MVRRNSDVIRSIRPLRACLAAVVLACALAAPALALNDKMTPIAIPAQPNAIALGTGALPGASVSESWHSQYGSVFARNVTVATLTPFLPDPAKATGAAVIVAPGGGFMTLSMQNEGWDVAKALAAKGVAAFVLKYRLRQTPAGLEDFGKSMAAMLAGMARAPGGADTFLRTVGQREHALMGRLFDGDAVACETALSDTLGQAR